MQSSPQWLEVTNVLSPVGLGQGCGLKSCFQEAYNLLGLRKVSI